MVHAQFSMSLARMPRLNLINEASGPNVSNARNRVVSRFLESDDDWLLMLDTDMIFPEDSAERLLSHEQPIVSGLYYQPGNPPFPCMYQNIGVGYYASINEWPDGALVKADSVGAGFLMVHRDVFTHISYVIPNRSAQWFQEIQMGMKLVGEDFAFCARAAECSYQVTVDTSLRAGHIKSQVI